MFPSKYSLTFAQFAAQKRLIKLKALLKSHRIYSYLLRYKICSADSALCKGKTYNSYIMYAAIWSLLESVIPTMHDAATIFDACL